MSVTYNSSLIKDGLILNLDASNTKSYSGTGSIWYDLSGGGHHGNLNGTSYGITSNVPSIICSGTSGWIGNTTLPGSWSSFTLELAFYHNGLDQNSSYGVISMGANGNYGPMFYNHSSGTGGHYFPGSPSGDYPGAVSGWNNLQWNLHTWVFEGIRVDNSLNSLKTYVDGVYTTGRSDFNFHNSGMGRGSNGYALGTYSGGGSLYKGSFNYFRVYNRALTANEVYHNFKCNRGRFNK